MRIVQILSEKKPAAFFAAGLGKKLILAAAPGTMVDKIFVLERGALDARLAWLGAVGYCLQLYFDFSGCIDMAIGLGTAFGFTTRENFQYPYTAISIGDFWRRWHMSLSAWFKDYVYIPLGGNRRGKLRTGINKSIVFVLCSIWHGANYTGTGGLTEQELRRATHNLSLMAQYCRENGKEFLFVIAPNKNSLYGRFMPDYGVKAGQRDARGYAAVQE